MSKERPILFSAPMALAILEGRKTVTRRAIKPSMRSADTQFELHEQPDGSWLPLHTFDESCMDDQGTEHRINCPYGQPGDRLWVRETWAQPANLDPGPIVYRATYPDCLKGQGWENLPPTGDIRWKPSIHMPRAASRILLEVTDVRVERLQTISDKEIESEGIDMDALADGQDRYDMCHAGSGAAGRPTARTAWRELWESINGPGAWDANSWVWVVGFKRVMP